MKSFSKIFFILLVFFSLCFGKVVYQTNSFLDTQDLGRLQYKTNLLGGTGGVDVYELGGKKYTLKGSQNTNHINEEIMADGLYKTLGVPVPSFIVLDSLEGLPNLRPSQEKWREGPYRIAEFIEGHPPTKEEIDKVKSSFVADAFLANRDVAVSIERNVIIKDSIAYRMDNGGSLRFRSKGDRKGEGEDLWDSSLIPELKTLLVHGGMVYEGLSQAQVQHQMHRILEKAPQLLQTFQKISRALNLSENSQTELDHMLVGRLRTLTVLANPDNTYAASRNRNTSPFTAAGAFLLSRDKRNQLYVLLGQRNSSQLPVHETWCTLGGKADYGIDADLATAASREIYEESDKRINIPDTELRGAPSHDLVRPDHLFRQYFVTVPHVDVADLHYHEYLSYKWISVEILLSPQTLETGMIEGTSMKLFEPFWDMLKTEQVQYLLKGYVLNRPPTRELHTQSTLQSPRLPLNGKISRFPSELSSTQFEKELQLGHTVLNKSIMMRDIKKRLAEETIDRLHYTSNEDPSPSYRYTASEAQLKIYLGDQYSPVTSLEILRSLKQNIDAALQKSKIDRGDKFFKAQLLSALMKERSYDPRFMVLYHACNGNIGFLYDIFTELRQLMSGQFHQNTQILRGIDEVFRGVEDIFAFQKKFGINPQDPEKNSFGGNYTEDYQDFALSSNFFLFGSPDTLTSYTVNLFLGGISQRPINIEQFLSYLESSFGGLKLNKNRYLQLYKSIMGELDNKDGRLYQIFIHPDYVNSLVQASLSGGHPFYLDYGGLRALVKKSGLQERFSDISTSVSKSCLPNRAPLKISLTPTSTAPKGFFEVLKEDPLLFKKALPDPSRSINFLQARLLLKPECLHNPKVVQTFVYQRTEKAQQNHEKFLTKLREYLRQDLALWLQAKEHMDRGVSIHTESPTAVRAQYGEMYKENFGRSYKTAENPRFDRALEKVNMSRNPSLLENLIAQYGSRQVLLTPISSTNNYRVLTPKYLIDEPWVVKYLEDLMADPSKRSFLQKEELLKLTNMVFIRKLGRINSSEDKLDLQGLIKQNGFTKVLFSPLLDGSRLIDADWVQKYIQQIMNGVFPELLPERELLANSLMEPMMSEINQLKDWSEFGDLKIPYLSDRLFHHSAKSMFAGVLERKLLQHPLSSKELLSIFKGVFFTESWPRDEVFNLNPSYGASQLFIKKLLRNFLDQKTTSFEEWQEFLTALKKLTPLPLQARLKEIIYRALLESSLSDEERKRYEPWERLYESALNKNDFVGSLYGLDVDQENSLEKYRLLKRTASLWGPHESEVVAIFMTIWLGNFEREKFAKGENPNLPTAHLHLTDAEIRQLTDFFEAVLPLMKRHSNSAVGRASPLWAPLQSIKLFVDDSSQVRINNPARTKALGHLKELIDLFLK